VKGNPLDAIEIRVPCTVSWEGMQGDDRRRYCGLCKLDVYNLSAMPRKEAEALVSGASGRLCVRLYRRPDGTVLTRNCRKILAFRRAAGAVAAGLVAWVFSVLAFSCRKEPGSPVAVPQALTPAPALPHPPLSMGRICIPTPPPEEAKEEMGDFQRGP